MRLSKRLLVKANALVRRTLFARRSFVRLIFGVNMVAPETVQSYCEWGSILQRFLLHRYAWPGARILDMGTGAHALLAVYAKKHLEGVSVVGTDILPDRVAWAAKTVLANGVEVELTTADLFDGLRGEFNLVLFHPPAIPTNELAELGFTPKSYPGIGNRRCWSGDGGPDALDTIRGFLGGVGQHLEPQGHAVLCVNPKHCDFDRLRPLFEQAKLRLTRVHRFPGIAHAYVLTRR